MKIVIASDHGGYEYKQMLIPFVTDLGHEVRDLGGDGSASDYPDMGELAAREVAAGRADVGVILCGTGIGISMTANKVHGIRAALCTDPLMARLSREHNNANMLALGGRIIGPELCKEIVKVFLATEPSTAERHLRRVGKIMAVENRQG